MNEQVFATEGTEHGVQNLCVVFEAEQLVSGIGLVLGLLVLGIALVRAEGLPRWVGWACIAGAVGAFAPLPVLPVVTGLQIDSQAYAAFIREAVARRFDRRAALQAEASGKALMEGARRDQRPIFDA